RGLCWCVMLCAAEFVVLQITFRRNDIATFTKVKPPEKSIASAKQTAAVLQGVKPHPRPAVTAGTSRPAVTASGSTPTDKALTKSAVRDQGSAVARSST
ncbi:phage holin family protein, partial [Streptomyces sp. NPDC059744]